MNIESIFKIIYYSYRLYIKIKWAIQNLKIACTAAVVLSAVAVVVNNHNFCEACNTSTTTVCHDKSFSVTERSSLSDIIGYVYDYYWYYDVNN